MKASKTLNRPDAFIIIERHSQLYIIFKEIDEHRHDDRSIAYEQIRMTLLTALAKRLGFKGIYFVRTNSAERKEIDRKQQDGMIDLIKKIMETCPEGVHAWYIDFPPNHHHVTASLERVTFDGADEATGEDGEDWRKPIFNSVLPINTGCQAGL